MHKIIITFSILALSSVASVPAFAQSPEIENACVNVAKNFLMADTVKVGTIQSFPELKPPGARFSYSTRPEVEKANMADWFECEFQNASAPFGLIKFCNASTCYSTDARNPTDKRRYDEAKALMDRAK